MQGEIAITEDTVKYNKMGWSVFDFFRHELQIFTTSRRAGWYAYIKRDSVYYFKWIDFEDEEKITKPYLELLRKDGYCIGMSATVIEDAFN
jgi:hypothetical protein